MAPDWRFGMFAVCMLVGALSSGTRERFNHEQRQLVLGLTAALLVWTFTVGNGRYFMTGLVMIGPLLVFAWRRLPGTVPFRYAALIGMVAVQCVAFWPSYQPNRWGLAQWSAGPAVDIEASPLMKKPAVFVTSTAISYSILVPKFHPDSRWTNVAGQRDLAPGMREYDALLALLRSPLPKYVVMSMPARPGSAGLQPEPLIRQTYGDQLLPLGLTLKATDCATLRSSLAPGPADAETMVGVIRGFWLCELDYSEAGRQAHAAIPATRPELAKAFRVVEQRCPRFFPPGNSNDRVSEGLTVRHYASDMRLLVDSQGQVYMKYFRAINPTLLGTLADVRQGRFELPCNKPPGRYQLPWEAD
jgi:hypothetical protein